MAVLSIPSQHPYVRSIYPRLTVHDVKVLDDPLLDPQEPARWWPHPAFTPQWWQQDTADTSWQDKQSIDTVHVHFGFEHLSVQETREFVAELRRRRIPLIITVHDIDNPHLNDQSSYHQQLRVLLEDAARILTLTPLAAQRLTQEFNVDPARIQVVAHPQVVPAETTVQPAHPPVQVGTFLKSVRSNVVSDFQFYKDAAAQCAQQGQRLSVFIHQDQQDAELFKQLENCADIDLRAHDEFSDDQLFAAIASCQAVLLPYQGGTHSGWMEMCRDLSVPVAVPDCGCFSGQADSADAVATYPTGDGNLAGKAASNLAARGHIPYQGNRAHQLKNAVSLHHQMAEELSGQKFNIAFVAPNRFPIVEPYAGGLEAFCASTVRALRESGHRVDFYAAQGSAGNTKNFEFSGIDWTGYEHQMTDHTYPPGEREKEDAEFRVLRQRLEKDLANGIIDLVYNNSLHPEFFGSALHPRLITTLHTPAFEEMQEGIAQAVSQHGATGAGVFTAVSQASASTWDLPAPAHIIPNSMNENLWTPGPGGQRAVWFGRVVPEKGPHLAIDAARQAGLSITVIGRVGDPEYFDAEISPRLGTDVEMVSECSQQELRTQVGKAAICFVTPQWDEPFGMVVIEALACGTPVVAFARGGIPEILADYPQLLVSPAEGATGLANAVPRALELSRAELSRWAHSTFGSKELAKRYTNLFSQTVGEVL